MKENKEKRNKKEKKKIVQHVNYSPFMIIFLLSVSSNNKASFK